MLMISVILLWYDVFIWYSKYLLNICLGCCFLVLKWGRLFKYEKKNVEMNIECLSMIGWIMSK